VKKSTLSKRLLAALATVPLLALLAGCAGGTADAGSTAGSDKTVKIGVVGASDPYWAVYTQAAADAGITVEIVDFSAYDQPNPALTAGEIDLNEFQHLVYLAQYNTASKADLTPIGSTAIYPLGLYSTKYKKLGDIQKGDTIAVPNDASNLSRALLVLQSAKLITLKDGGSIRSTLDDIDTDASKVTVTAVEASLTATSLPDVAGAVVNNDFVEKAGLKFTDALAKDDPTDPTAVPYVNVFVARASDKDNATYQKLVQIFQDTQAVRDGLVAVSGGSAVLAKTPVADLVSSLATVVADTEAKK
jgi:D-methionine transport system substrate-binding protein